MQLAVRSLEGTKRKVRKKKELAEKYEKTIKECICEGHARKLTDERQKLPRV